MCDSCVVFPGFDETGEMFLSFKTIRYATINNLVLCAEILCYHVGNEYLVYLFQDKKEFRHKSSGGALRLLNEFIINKYSGTNKEINIKETSCRNGPTLIMFNQRYLPQYNLIYNTRTKLDMIKSFKPNMDDVISINDFIKIIKSIKSTEIDEIKQELKIKLVHIINNILNINNTTEMKNDIDNTEQIQNMHDISNKTIIDNNKDNITQIQNTFTTSNDIIPAISITISFKTDIDTAKNVLIKLEDILKNNHIEFTQQ